MNLTKKNETIEYSNEDDTSRDYTIAADVIVQNGAYRMTRNGRVYPKNPENNLYLAQFSVGENESLAVNFQPGVTDAQRVSLLNLIHTFITAAKANVNTATE